MTAGERRLRHAGTWMTRVLAASLALVAAGGVGWWAGRTALDPPRAIIDAVSRQWYTVSEGTVGSVTQAEVLAQWPAVGLASARSTGVVTERFVQDGAEIISGTIVGSVDLAPVVVAIGAVPAFRDLEQGTAGADVTQLQHHLVGVGLLAPDEADGVFGSATDRAVREWEAQLGRPQTGRVPLGRVVFVSSLPARLRWRVGVGDTTTPGAPLFELLAPVPTFTATVAATRLSELPPGSTVDIEGPSGVRWRAVTGPVLTPGEDPRTVALEPGGEGPICTPDCATIDVVGTTRFTGSFTVVPESTGPRIPVAAITTGPEGTPSVEVEGRGRVDITILAVAEGFAIVDGVDVGDQVLVDSITEGG